MRDEGYCQGGGQTAEAVLLHGVLPSWYTSCGLLVASLLKRDLPVT